MVHINNAFENGVFIYYILTVETHLLLLYFSRLSLYTLDNYILGKDVIYQRNSPEVIYVKCDHAYGEIFKT